MLSKNVYETRSYKTSDLRITVRENEKMRKSHFRLLTGFLRNSDKRRQSRNDKGVIKTLCQNEACRKCGKVLCQ